MDRPRFWHGLRPLLRPFITALALVLVGYEWLWDALRQQVQKLRRWPAMLQGERWVRALSPWPSLGIMALPLLVLLPFKLAALWALGHGHTLLGVAIYVAAKVVGMALVSYVFDLARDSARRLPWFDRLYGGITGVLARAKAWVNSRPAVQAARAWVQGRRAALRAWWAAWRHRP